MTETLTSRQVGNRRTSIIDKRLPNTTVCPRPTPSLDPSTRTGSIGFARKKNPSMNRIGRPDPAKTCSLAKQGKVYILTLLGNDDHRFNPTTIDAICDALNEVEQSSDAAALVTTNAGKYFSNGLDLRWIAESPDDRLEIIREKFENMLAAFMRLGVPTVAAICGHAAAGGFMTALAHDYRFMTQGRSVLYMSELDHGMLFPRSLMALVRSKCLPAARRDVVLGARKLSAEMGVERGILDGVLGDPAETLRAAVEAAEELAGRGWKRKVYRGIRLGAFPGVVEELDAHTDPYLFHSALSKL